MTGKKDNGTLRYHSKIVGVTFEGRQKVLASLKGDEMLAVRREKDNEYDSNAVAVDVKIANKWVPVGYIAKDKNADIAQTLDNGGEVRIRLGGVTGGKDKSYGMNIELEYTKVTEKPKIEEAKPEEIKPVTDSDVKRVLQHLLSNTTSKPEGETIEYHSVLLKQSKMIQVVNGHKRIEGYMSGSKFPEKFFTPFPKDMILNAWVKKHGVSRESIEAMWQLNNEASTGYGSAIHAAMENYHKNRKLGEQLRKVTKYKTKDDEAGPNKAFSRNPFLKQIVEWYIELFGDDEHPVLTEEFIWDDNYKLCGSIDLLKIVDAKKGVVRIQDYKTDGDIHTPKSQVAGSPFRSQLENTLLDYHWLQLSFYAFMLKQVGLVVEGLDVYWVNPNKLVKGENPWEIFSHDVIDVSEAIVKQ